MRGLCMALGLIRRRNSAPTGEDVTGNLELEGDASGNLELEGDASGNLELEGTT